MPSLTLPSSSDDKSTISHHLPGLFFLGIIPIQFLWIPWMEVESLVSVVYWNWLMIQKFSWRMYSTKEWPGWLVSRAAHSGWLSRERDPQPSTISGVPAVISGLQESSASRHLCHSWHPRVSTGLWNSFYTQSTWAGSPTYQSPRLFLCDCEVHSQKCPGDLGLCMERQVPTAYYRKYHC